MKIGIKTCKYPSFVLIYGQSGMENCMVLLIEIVHEASKERKLFCLAPTTRYCRLVIRMEVFWPFKVLLCNDELVVMVFNQGNLTMDGVNNLAKK
jgi:hypothetical protein